MDEGTERAGAEAVGDDVWRFATRDLPPDQRCAAWGEAMRRLRLPEVSPHGPGPVDGTITVAVSPMGLQFARIAADGQTIAGQSSDAGEGLWIGVLIEGQGLLQGEGVDTGVRPGMILCGITRNPARLVLDGRHVMLFVNVPRFVIAPRLLAQNQSPLLVIPGEGVLATVAYGLLAGAARALEAPLADLAPAGFGPVDTALVEFLAALIAEAGGPQARGGGEGARAALLQRILQRMEVLLGDPDLSLAGLAADAGISPRYLRRLFAGQDLNFAATLKARRLERCRADLVSPLHAQLSISEIAFRWGFNDAAHFSRSFNERFGLSPRAWRRQGLGQGAGEPRSPS
ncbi:helix-turn-helix domain-containing protein [Novosphingobium nitrogenifigens]|nr:helix-turn-helix domain-containing protein [Novosphingobium nitrogenifigens]